jgi:hypothetical protein
LTRNSFRHRRPKTSSRSDWQRALPVLRGARVVLRELRASDAPSLFAMLSADEVARFISPPPTTVSGFEQFIAWTLRQRSAGTYACFAVTVRGYDTAIGIFQMRQIDADFRTAEWGFAIGSALLGHRRVPRGRGSDARLRVRDRRGVPPRGARVRAERPRQWRAAEGRRGQGKRFCGSRSCGTASRSTKCWYAILEGRMARHDTASRSSRPFRNTCTEPSSCTRQSASLQSSTLVETS